MHEPRVLPATLRDLHKEEIAQFIKALRELLSRNENYREKEGMFRTYEVEVFLFYLETRKGFSFRKGYTR